MIFGDFPNNFFFQETYFVISHRERKENDLVDQKFSLHSAISLTSPTQSFIHFPHKKIWWSIFFNFLVRQELFRFSYMVFFQPYSVIPANWKSACEWDINQVQKMLNWKKDNWNRLSKSSESESKYSWIFKTRRIFIRFQNSSKFYFLISVNHFYEYRYKTIFILHSKDICKSFKDALYVT